MRHLMCLLLFILPLHAQVFYRFEPIEHRVETPPKILIPHKRIAIYGKGQPGYQELATSFRNLLLDDYEVLAREDLDALLDEHNLSLDGVISKNKASGLGKFLGPTALIILDLQRLRTADQMVTQGAKRSITLKADVRVMDIQTGQITFSKPITEQYEEIGAVDYPDEEVLRQKAFEAVEQKMSNWFLPKVKTAKLDFHTPKRRPAFKEAFGYVAIDEHDQALAVMNQAVETITEELEALKKRQPSLSGKDLKKSKKSVKKATQDLGRAWQNVAVIQLLREDFKASKVANGRAKVHSDMSGIYRFPAYLEQCRVAHNRRIEYQRLLKKRS
ncbi:CsgG/HfaB family protein [Acanthopleuribacter pedis]|uniref:Curli production assembly/transport component CsgG n=1 Tax=Acanthopleuribacter pedis TaxID=442870 RepID=A0A8J7Q2X4_9BACT|nr:CsgG/HfaB family protein [Acanthopleuribacter pedis]MBO1318255.1 hypothetical protein [Acanthopleuribacter pedis]